MYFDDNFIIFYFKELTMDWKNFSSRLNCVYTYLKEFFYYVLMEKANDWQYKRDCYNFF